MLALLFGASAGRVGRYVPITRASFRRLVENRPKHEIWVMMLHTDTNFLSKKLYPLFVNASNLAGGMFRFGVIDTKREPLLARQFRLNEQPGYLVFSSKGQTQYTGSGDPEDIIQFASTFLTDRAIEIGDDWLDNPRPSAILFTEKKETPILWVGVSHAFHKKNVRIGICRNHRLQQTYGFTHLPGILFVNKTLRYNYTGKITFPRIESELTKFIDKGLKFEDTSALNVVHPSAQFGQNCIGAITICVLNAKEEKDEAYEEIRRVFAHLKYKWFQGVKGLPFDFIRRGEVWIYNPRLDGLINVSHVPALADELRRVADGTMSWKSRAALTKDAESTDL
jgi:hypothetical protein